MSQIVNESCFDESPSGKRKNQNNTVEDGAPQMSRRRAGSMSDSVQPMQDVQRTVGHSSTASPHLPDSLRALYFAPVAMIVLDQKRTFVMVNGMAEGLLGVDSQTCIGQAWEFLLPLTSQQTLETALNKATEKFSISTVGLSTPLSTRLEIEQATKGTRWIDLSIAVWHQSQAISALSREEEKEEKEEKAGHELFFTLTLSPSITIPTQDNNTVPPCDTNSNNVIHGDTKSDIIYEFVLQDLSLAMLACDKQGKIVERNKASDDFWSLLGPAPTKSTDEWGEKDWDKNEFDLSWVVDMADFFDEHFQEPFPPCDWPVYRCAILGESSPPVLMGIRLKSSGIQYVVEAIGYPVRDKNGTHIGGVVTFRNVSAEKERLRIEAEQQGDLHFQQTCNLMPQLTFVTDPVGRSEWYSKSWYEFSGASHDVSDTEAWGQYWHPDDLAPALDQWKKAIVEEELWESIFRVKRYDGMWRWFQGRALPIKDGNGKINKWYGTCTDINDHLEALAASKRAQSQLESVIAHANVTLWATNREGVITIAKGPGVGILGLELEGKGITSGTESPSRNGQSIYDAWHSTNTIQDVMKRALAGETVIEEMEMGKRWFRTSYTPMRAQAEELAWRIDEQSSISDDNNRQATKNIIGVVGASMDVTERKAAQAEMEKSLSEKTSALAAEEAARHASRLKSEFLANMSHEVRTPIAGVIGLSELILDETSLTPQLQNYVETIQRSAEGLLNVINDILDFSKVEIGKLTVEQAPFNLNTLLIDAKRMLTFATEKKGLDFNESIELTYSGLLIGDFGRLKQVLINLLTNAIKFTMQGYVSLQVTESNEDENRIEIRFDVRDTGCGIEESSLSRLFQPFSQADPSTARRFGGTGLGLSISKKLVELMEGRIGLDSVEGQGSHAWFCIPFLKAARGVYSEKRETEEEKEEIEEIPTHSLRPRGDIWILIAEDNEVNARIALKNVERMGFQCRLARDGLEALQELGNRRYDLVLMDCQMPECDGYKATGMMRQSNNPLIRSLPVIALTASAIKGDRERAIEAGMVDYLSKPVKRDALESTLCKWLFDHHARQVLAKYTRMPISPLRPGMTLL